MIFSHPKVGILPATLKMTDEAQLPTGQKHRRIIQEKIKTVGAGKTDKSNSFLYKICHQLLIYFYFSNANDFKMNSIKISIEKHNVGKPYSRLSRILNVRSGIKL